VFTLSIFQYEMLGIRVWRATLAAGEVLDANAEAFGRR
jgi:hypothetical protein